MNIIINNTKLIPLSDFVLERVDKISALDLANQVVAYTKFLKQPLTLGMFVPVDKQDNVLEPLQFCCTGSDCGCLGMPVNVSCQEEIDEYYEAKEEVLFEGFEVGKFGFKDQYYVKLGKNENSIYPFPNVRNYVVEDLVDLGIELTPSALEAIGIKEGIIKK